MSSEAAHSFDLIVVGLGAMGSAALYQATRRGLRVLGIDRFDPPHELGSSHAETRVTRLAVGEGPQYLPFVARSHQIWRDIETQTGVELLYQPGGYIITPPTPTVDARWGGFVDRTSDIAVEAGIPFEIRQPDQAAEHLQRVVLQGNESIGFEPTGGIVMCERAVATQLSLARSAGATTIVNTPVQRVAPDGDGVRISTATQTYTAASAIVSTGAWFAELAPPADGAAVAVTRQAVYWFEVDDPQDFGADRFPFVIWPGHTIEDYSAVFPIPARGRPGLKLLGEQFHEETTPNDVDRAVHQSEIDDYYERLVVPRLTGVRNSVIDTTVCLYTNTADDHFLIDAHPECGQILYASPCSGHGFKHSAALGEAMVSKLLGSTDGLDLSPFVRNPNREQLRTSSAG